MSNDELNQAIELIKQGQDTDAQAILQGLIRANPQDLTAWSWYVKSFHTPEKRLDALELSLRFNPGNQQIIEAIQKLRGKLSPEPSPSFRMESTPTPSISPREFSPYAVAEAPQPTREEPLKFVGLDDVSGRPFMWWDVWWLSVRYPDEKMYTALLRDPLANLGRACWWVFLSSLVVWLISLFNPDLLELANQIETTQGGKTISTLVGIGTLAAIPFAAAASVLLTMLSALLYNLMAKMMGGTGNFTRTFYLMAAYRAPIDIILGILSIIPCVNLLSIIVSFYAFRLHVAAIQAAHRLNGMRATIVVLLPTFIILVGFCLLGVVFANALANTQLLKGH